MIEPTIEFKPSKYYTLKKFQPELIPEPTKIDAIITCFMLSKFNIREDIYEQLPNAMKEYFELDLNLMTLTNLPGE